MSIQKSFSIGRVKINFDSSRASFFHFKPLSFSLKKYRDYISLGENALQNKRYSRAIRCFTKAAKLQPDNPNAYIYLGSILSLKGDYAGAERNFTKAIEKYSSNFSTYAERGKCRFRLKNFEGAAADFRMAIELSNPVPAHYRGLADALSALGKTDEAKECLQTYNELNDLLSRSWPDYYKAGFDFYSNGKYAQAVVELSKAIRISPDESLPHLILAGAYLRLGKLPEARSNAEKALTLNPNVKTSQLYKEIAEAH